jgi:hypothetical protein
MNTNKLFALLGVLVLVIVMAGPVVSQTFSTIAKGYPAQVADTAITGFVAPASATQALSSAAAVKIGVMPANTVAVTIVASGAMNFGSSSVKTSTDGIYRTIATGGEVTIKLWPGTINPDIYLIPNATGAANIVARIICHVAK